MQNFLTRQHLQDRMVSDLKIADELARKLFPEDIITIVDSGYAVELLCSKMFSRFHYDLDLILICKNMTLLDNKFILDIVNSIKGSIQWVSLDTVPTWIWLRESEYKHKEIPRQINIKGIQLREYNQGSNEIEVISTSGQEYKIPLVVINSSLPGRVSEFLVPDVNWQCATKLRLIKHYAKDYQIREGDKHDFALLLKHNNFDLNQVVKYLADYYGGKHSLDSEASQSEALDTFLSLLQKHPSISPEYLKILTLKTGK